MKLALAGNILGYALSAAECLIPEATLKVTNEGLRILDMDPANVAMVNLNIPKDSFVQFELDEGKEEEIISVSLSNLRPILKRAGKDDIVSISLVGDARLKLSFDHRKFEVPLIDIEDNKEQKEPEIKPIYSVTTKTKDFMQILSDASIIGESLSFFKAKDAEQLTVKTEGDKLTKFESSVPTETVELDTKDKILSKFALEYLNKMVKSSYGTTVKIELGNDYPLRLNFHNDSFNVRYILAPRVESS